MLRSSNVPYADSAAETVSTDAARPSTVSLVWGWDGLQREVRALREFARVAEDLPRVVEFVVIQNGVAESDEWVRVVDSLSKAKVVRFKQLRPISAVLSSVLSETKGDSLVLLPSFMEVDANSIEAILGHLDQGYDCVSSMRVPRIDSPINRFGSRVFNFLARFVTGSKLHDLDSRLRAMRREVIDGVPVYGDLFRYVPIFAEHQGFRVGECRVPHHSESSGDRSSVCGLCVRRTLDLLALFFLIRFTQKPFRFFGGIGAVLFASGCGIDLILAIQRLCFDRSLADRPMLVLGTMLIALGIQLFSLGLLGELIIFVNAGGLSANRVQKISRQATRERS